MPEERYEPGTELYAARDCQGWQWGEGDEGPETVSVNAARGDFLGTVHRYWSSGHYVMTARDGARYDWDVNDVTAGAVQQELGL
jgi:hypothetical protein